MNRHVPAGNPFNKVVKLIPRVQTVVMMPALCVCIVGG